MARAYDQMRCTCCKYYTEDKKYGQKFHPSHVTGYCTNEWQLTHGANDRKRPYRIDRRPTAWDFTCKRWVDVETGETRDEIIFGKKE